MFSIFQFVLLVITMMVSARPQEQPVTDNPPNSDGNNQQWNPVLSSDIPSSDNNNDSGAALPNPAPSDSSDNQGGATPSPDNCDQSQTESNSN